MRQLGWRVVRPCQQSVATVPTQAPLGPKLLPNGPELTSIAWHLAEFSYRHNGCFPKEGTPVFHRARIPRSSNASGPKRCWETHLFEET